MVHNFFFSNIRVFFGALSLNIVFIVHFSIVNVPALSLNIIAPNGQALSRTSAPVTVGENVNFGVEVTPGGTGPASMRFVQFL